MLGFTSDSDTTNGQTQAGGTKINVENRSAASTNLTAMPNIGIYPIVQFLETNLAFALDSKTDEPAAANILSRALVADG